MYLHINKNCVIKNNSIIGMFSLNKIDNEEFENLCKNINVIDYSNNSPKTFILTEEMGKYRGYILKLEIDTIQMRLKS